jgi:hypothetical protein
MFQDRRLNVSAIAAAGSGDEAEAPLDVAVAVAGVEMQATAGIDKKGESASEKNRSAAISARKGGNERKEELLFINSNIFLLLVFHLFKVQ